MRNLLKFLSIIAVLLLGACNHTGRRHVHHTTNQPGYCYYDNGLWYIYYMNANGSYTYAGTSSNFSSYDNSTASWAPSTANTTNFSEVPAEVAADMSETTGEATGGSTGESESSDAGGMSESSGESTGGSDGASDGGSSDGGGGDGGGGGE